MDIDLLSKMVKELILDQDRVVLPGLGSFVAEVVPSTFSDKGYTINPPYRRLFFRSKPDEGDDLTSFYASSNNVELDLADRIIKEFISELKSVLHEKKTVVFPGLGRLRATKENHVFFVADESLDIYPAGFGLEPISLKTHQETAEEVAAAVEGLKTLLKEPAPAPVPVEKPVPQPVSAPEPAPAPAPVPEPVATIAPEPAPAPVPEPAAVTEPMPDPAPQPVPPAAPAAPSAPDHVRKSRTGLRLSVGLAAAAAVLLVAYMIIGRTRPDLVDPFLYTPEELEIVKML